MEGTRFDRFARAFATRRSRRQAVRAVGAGAAIAAAGAPGRSLAQAAAGVQTCVLEIEIAVRFGPSFDDAGEDLVLTGELRLPIGERGRVDDGLLALDDDDEEYPVVGQVDGRAVSLVVEYGRRERITLVGVADELLAECRGEVGGPVTGPARGDLGDWRAIALELLGAAEPTPTPYDAGSGGGDEPDPTATPDLCAPQTCDEGLQWDADLCECNCAFTGGDPAPCFGECCTGTYFCLESGCGCPAGYETCGDGCVAACEAGYDMDWNACECFAN